MLTSSAVTKIMNETRAIQCLCTVCICGTTGVREPV